MGNWGRVVVWTLILFMFTCTHNLDALLWHHVVYLEWGGRVHWSDFLMTSDFRYGSPYFWFIKSGHFLGFATLDVLLFRATRNRRSAFLLTFFFAVFTEVLQLHFGRDGRLYDVVIDSLGAAWSAHWFRPAKGWRDIQLR